MTYPLTQPTGVAPAAAGAKVWQMEADSSSVAKGWDAIVLRDPNAAVRAFQWLRDHPFQRYPGRCFPRRGNRDKGVWEYRVNAADRLLYCAVISDSAVVLILYAGDYH